MTFYSYTKSLHLFFIITVLIFLVVASILLYINIPLFIVIGLALLTFLPLILSQLYLFFYEKSFYENLSAQSHALDQKYILTELMERPDFVQGQFVYDVMKNTNKNMHEKVNEYKVVQAEYREYIEMWIHEVKTPIAASKLIVKNQRNVALNGLQDELDAIESYVEQALYYARSNDVHKDYRIRSFCLENCVKKAIQKNARSCIQQKIRIELNELDKTVHSDEKWILFILQQLMSNSIKYRRNEQPFIRFSASVTDVNVVLTIEDNGIGMSEEDVRYAFEKGFTGKKVRIDYKSTGIGLYLCKKLTTKLHLGLQLESKEGYGTKVHLIFPTDSKKLLYTT